MSFQQVIAGKVKLNGLGGIRRHMAERQRVKTNPNIDLSRSHLNYRIDSLTPDKLTHRVNERIKELKLKKLIKLLIMLLLTLFLKIEKI